MLQQSLLPTQTYEVRVQAARAVCAFVLIHEKGPEVFKHFSDILPDVIKVMESNLTKN